MDVNQTPLQNNNIFHLKSSFKTSHNDCSKDNALIKGAQKIQLKDTVDLLIEKKDYFLAQLILGQRLHYLEDNSEPIMNVEEKIKTIIKMGYCFEERGFISEAIKCYKQLEKFDLSFFANSKIGHLYYKENDLKKAESIYLEALLSLNENTILNEKVSDLFQPVSHETFQIYKNLGNINLKKGNTNDAESFYYKAFSINPESSELYVNLATLELIKGNESNALEKYRKSIYLNDKNDKAWSGLALIYDSYGDFELTNACLKKAIELNDQNTNALHLFSQFCSKHNKPNEAILLLQNWTSKNQFHIDVYLYLIELYIQTNQIQPAKTLINISLL